MNPSLEVLESRIAPAAVFIYTEADGDSVTIKTSAKITKDDFAAYIAAHASFSGEGTGLGDLYSLTLDDPVFRNTNLTITVDQLGGGDGLASIGDIDAEVDLKNVIIEGSLRSIDVGDSNYATVGLTKLQVQNLGSIDGDTDDTDLRGGVKSIKIIGDLNSEISAGDYEEGNGVGGIGTITVGGSVGQNGEISARKIGTLKVDGNMGGLIDARSIKSVRIGGDLIGTTNDTGAIYAESIKSVRITGSIVGGGEAYSGGISADVIGTVIVGGNISGGDGGHSGYIYGDDEIGKVIVVGSLIGGNGDMSGMIESEGDVGLIRIDGDLVAGDGDLSGSIALVYHEDYYDEYYDELEDRWVYDVELDYFETAGHVDKIVVGGSLIGAVEVELEPEVTEIFGGDASGSIFASSIGSLRVNGDVIGGVNDEAGSILGGYLGSAYIGGSLIGGTDEDTGSIVFGGIGSVRILESVIGGNDYDTGIIFGYEGINSVKIGGNLTGGNAPGSGSIGSEYGSIESIVIGGSFSSASEMFEGISGIFAGGSIGRVTIGGSASGSEYGSFGIRAGYNHPSTSSVPSIGSVSIKGDVTNFLIEAGVGIYGEVNYDASIGSVSIGGNFTKSAIAAGVGVGPDGFYGTPDDIIDLHNPEVISRIASVLIGGTATGTLPDAGNPEAPANFDNYGIFAQHIVALKVNGAKVSLSTGATNDLTGALLTGSTDVRYSERPLTMNAIS